MRTTLIGVAGFALATLASLGGCGGNDEAGSTVGAGTGYAGSGGGSRSESGDTAGGHPSPGPMGASGSWGSSGSSGGTAGGWSGGSGAGGGGGSSPPPNPPAADGGVAPPPGDGAAGAAPPPTCESLDQTRANTLFLSADDSNSMASPAIVRKLINRGWPVPPNLIRTYEFLNYYRFDYTPAPAGTLAIYPDMRPGTAPGTYELQLGVASERADAANRKQLNLTFVLDTSGSMAGERIEIQRAAVRAIAHNLKRGDIVSMVTWSTVQQIVLTAHEVDGPDDRTLIAASEALEPGGGTDLNGGLVKGYDLATRTYARNALNRVIVISDGEANAGITEKSIIAQNAQAGDGDGIYLVGIGVGDGVGDTMMDAVTDAGRGAYVFLDTASEAETMLYTRFDEVMDVAARSVQVELKLPWYLQMQRFYGETFSGDPSEVDPQHLAPSDAMVFSQIIETCALDRVSGEDPIEVIARFETPITHEARTTSVMTTVGQLLDGQSRHLAKGSAVVAFAEALKKGSLRSDLTAARGKADAADPMQLDRDLNEIRSLIDRMAQ